MKWKRSKKAAQEAKLAQSGGGGGGSGGGSNGANSSSGTCKSPRSPDISSDKSCNADDYDSDSGESTHYRDERSSSISKSSTNVLMKSESSVWSAIPESVQNSSANAAAAAAAAAAARAAMLGDAFYRQFAP